MGDSNKFRRQRDKLLKLVREAHQLIYNYAPAPCMWLADAKEFMQESVLMDAEPPAPAPSSSPVQQPDAGDAVLATACYLVEDDVLTNVVKELARRALAERPPATDATGEQP